MALPAEHKQLLLVNNGAADFDASGTYRYGAAFLPGGHLLLSATDVGHQTVSLREIVADFDNDGMIGYWWHPEWVLFGRHIAADGLAIDQRQGPGQGIVGEFMHEDSTDFDMAPSLSEFIAKMADSLEAGTDFLLYRPTIKDDYLDWKVIVPGPARVTGTDGGRARGASIRYGG
jgi:hypothetical protein